MKSEKRLEGRRGAWLGKYITCTLHCKLMGGKELMADSTAGLN
jgi:hypothetical protein